LPADPSLTAETTELLQALIRNACVNDGTPESGEEVRNSDLLTSYLEGPGLELTHHEPLPGRRSILGRIEGSDPNARTLMLMGHTDVVPVSPDDWREDPFGGEVIDGEVWGRGAIDMLNLTASMAVAFRRLADEGFSRRGDLVYLAVADEEAGGTWGRSGWPAPPRKRCGPTSSLPSWAGCGSRSVTTPCCRSASRRGGRSGAGSPSGAPPGTGRCRCGPTTR
jgi:acetylornithine deacetylase/succinyl-diaminopimelate desuccinylase-like protein